MKKPITSQLRNAVRRKNTATGTRQGTGTGKPAYVKLRKRGDAPDREPVWIRLPREGAKCEYCNLSRASLRKLCLPEPGELRRRVRAVHVPNETGKRQALLIHRQSLLDYLDSLTLKPASPDSSDAA